MLRRFKTTLGLFCLINVKRFESRLACRNQEEDQLIEARFSRFRKKYTGPDGVFRPPRRLLFTLPKGWRLGEAVPE